MTLSHKEFRGAEIGQEITDLSKIRRTPGDHSELNEPAAARASRNSGRQITRRGEQAMQIYEMRRLRQQFLPQDILAEPAWDILLTLYIGHENQTRTNVTDVCAFAGVPPTTALRWIKRLIEMGFVETTAHPTDRRVSWLSLSKEGIQRLENFCDRLAKFPHGTAGYA